jgi:hypothetical protein
LHLGCCRCRTFAGAGAEPSRVCSARARQRRDYKPDSGPAPHVAFLIAHRSANNLNNVACRELSQRGFLAFCFNTRFVNNDSIVQWEQIALDVKTAVDYVRTIPGITKVVLLGP